MTTIETIYCINVWVKFSWWHFCVHVLLFADCINHSCKLVDLPYSFTSKWIDLSETFCTNLTQLANVSVSSMSLKVDSMVQIECSIPGTRFLDGKTLKWVTCQPDGNWNELVSHCSGNITFKCFSFAIMCFYCQVVSDRPYFVPPFTT